MKKTFLVALGLSAAAAAGFAQDAAPRSGPASSPKIAVIDMQQISSESALGKSYASKIEALENEMKTAVSQKQAELGKMDAAIKTLQDELDKQSSVLSPEAADKKKQDIVKKQRDRQAYLEDGQADLERMKQRAEQQQAAMNNEFQQKIKPAIDAVAREKGIDIILTSQVALTMNPNFDISKDVIAKSDADNKTAAAAAPAAKPAAAAPRPAAPAAAAPTVPKPAPSPK
jgi:outer membrane protein